MTNLTALKLEIATEMNRDDIAVGGETEATMVKHIQDACEYFADTKFWFNSLVTTVNTVAGTQTVAIPSGVRIVERVTLPAREIELQEVQIGELDDSAESSEPRMYAYYNDSLRLWPTPAGIYTLRIYGIASVAAPTIGADTSIWTNQASRLIRARTKQTLYRGVFRDAEGATLAAAEVIDELDRLNRETTRRLTSPLRARYEFARPDRSLLL